MKAVPLTQALKEFRAWIAAEPESSIASVAEALHVSGPAVFQWLNLKARPDRDVRERIELLTGIAASGWETKDEREDRLRFAADAIEARSRFAKRRAA